MTTNQITTFMTCYLTWSPFFWSRDIIKETPVRSYSSFETYFDLYPTGSPLLMVHWCGPLMWSDWSAVQPIRSHLYWPMKSSFTLFLWKYKKIKSDHQPITKWIIYYFSYSYPNDKTIRKIINSTLPVRFLKPEVLWARPEMHFLVQRSYLGWIPRNSKTFNFEPKLSFSRKNQKNYS